MLQKQDVKRLLPQLESENIERTRAFDRTEKMGQAICAFANDLPNRRCSSYLFLGVENDGTLSGKRITDEQFSSLGGLKTDGNLLPPPSMALELFHFDEGDVVAIEVFPSLYPPIRFKGQVWVRVGPRKSIATADDIHLLEERRLLSGRRFEEFPCPQARLEDLRLDLFTHEYLPKAVALEVIEDDVRTVEEQLATLRFYDREKHCPTNLGVLLFGRHPESLIPSAYIQYVHFVGEDNGTDILQQHEFKGPLIRVVQELETFAKTAIAIKRPVLVSPLREEIISRYPDWAIRELLLNAIIHRDYEIGNAPIKFYEYNHSRLEISNSGGLFGQARPENFPFVSDYRNPLLSEALIILGYTKTSTHGFDNISAALQGNGNEPPIFDFHDESQLHVTLHASPKWGGTDRHAPRFAPGVFASNSSDTTTNNLLREPELDYGTNLEKQNVEWKEEWKDEYLRWICGFANAQGGTLYIGMRDDGTIVGLKNFKKLLETLPNKIQNKLGIVVDVNLLEENAKKYLQIVVHPQVFPVNYNGEYHYRSGSTKQQLTGNALNNFIWTKSGIRWDSVPMRGIQIEDLDKESFDIFRRQALRNRRMTEEDLDIPREELLRRLSLLSEGFLTRAGVLCFHREASCFVTGCFVKIGMFEGCEILYQDEVRGSLLLMADRAVDLVFLKYLKARISYDKDTRVETYPYLREALREAVYNALIHSNWMLGVPIQIRVEPRSIWVSNACTLPFGWNAETLTQEHSSIPFNPDIANVFYRAGYIESWGRGIQKIFNACDAQAYPRPVYEVLGSTLRLHFFAKEEGLVSSSASVPFQVHNEGNTIQKNEVISEEKTKEETTQKTKEKTTQKNEDDTTQKTTQKTKVIGDGKTKVVAIDTVSEETDVIHSGIADKKDDVRACENAICKNGEENPSKKTKVINEGKTTQKTKGKTTQKTKEKTTQKYRGTKAQLRTAEILLLVRNNPWMTIREIARHTKLTIDGVKWDLNKLKDQGLLERVGSDRAGHWVVKSLSFPTETEVK